MRWSTCRATCPSSTRRRPAPAPICSTHEPSCDIATLVAPEGSLADRTDPDVVKAILAMEPKRQARGRALYFTRSTLYGEGPSGGTSASTPIAARPSSASPPRRRRRWRRREKLEQLRALEIGLSIWAAVVPTPSPIVGQQPSRSRQGPAHGAELRRPIGERPPAHRLSGRAWAPTATRPAATTSPTTSRLPAPLSRTPSRPCAAETARSA